MSWDGPSCVIGIFIGMSIMLIIHWICYSQRVFIYADIPIHYPECRYSNYFNNPGNAVANGSNPEDILTITDDKMTYKRVPKDVCVPGSNQDVRIWNPQYCEFLLDDGTKIEAKNTFFESPYYISTKDVGTSKLDIISSPNCNPISNSRNLPITGGYPLLLWDPLPNN